MLFSMSRTNTRNLPLAKYTSACDDIDELLVP